MLSIKINPVFEVNVEGQQQVKLLIPEPKDIVKSTTVLSGTVIMVFDISAPAIMTSLDYSTPAIVLQLFPKLPNGLRLKIVSGLLPCSIYFRFTG
jgi:hypothetical protein